MNEDESLRRYGLRPSSADLPRIRQVLLAEAERDQQDQDTELMKLCCLQLFNAGQLSDVLVIWRAKESSFDAHCSIDVQLLCGAGLAATKAHLEADGSPDAADARQYLLECEAAGDFDGFSAAEQSRWRADYYLT
ncbi:hypothetical protein OOJ91_16820 [Micromonospora lupini]|uniref:hypothetical protein n=1 Tax=Micromonospora lupini TaxID=285679 RepID=UPI00225321A5|nr:hypothetical protein [Micromonospora lupini]MCX5067507.1 hypothetical protein [Micromonospora lupini]